MANKKELSETDYRWFYDAGEFVESIMKFINSESYKSVAGQSETDYERGFKAGLCTAPCVLMVNASCCMKIPKSMLAKKKAQEETD